MRSSETSAADAAGSFKVGYVLKRFPRLSETFVVNEILELERQGVEVEIFSLRRAKDELRHELLDRLRAKVTYLADIKVADARVPSGARELVRNRRAGGFELLMPGKGADDAALIEAKAMTIARRAVERGVQHLHAHFASDATTAALIAGRMSGLPFSFTAHARDIFHCYLSREVDDAVRRSKIRAARFVATVSDFNKRHLDQIAAADGGSNVIRLYNGINLQRFSPPVRLCRKEGLILSVGRLVEKKGLEDLVAACRILCQRGIDMRCEIVGEGPLRRNLEARIAEYGLGNTVTLLGAQPHERVCELMRHASLFVLPCVVSASGDRDGLPTVLLEALASGLPSVSTNVAGIPEIIRHEQTGLLVEPSSPGALAAAIDRIITDRRLAARLAAQGRQHALVNFDLGVNVAMLCGLFRGGHQAQWPNDERSGDAHRLSVS